VFVMTAISWQIVLLLLLASGISLIVPATIFR
jgi:hypothetical protein